MARFTGRGRDGYDRPVTMVAPGRTMVASKCARRGCSVGWHWVRPAMALASQSLGVAEPNAAGRTRHGRTELRGLCEGNNVLLPGTITVFRSLSVAILAQGMGCTLCSSDSFSTLCCCDWMEARRLHEPGTWGTTRPVGCSSPSGRRLRLDDTGAKAVVLSLSTDGSALWTVQPRFGRTRCWSSREDGLPGSRPGPHSNARWPLVVAWGRVQ